MAVPTELRGCCPPIGKRRTICLQLLVLHVLHVVRLLFLLHPLPAALHPQAIRMVGADNASMNGIVVRQIVSSFRVILRMFRSGLLLFGNLENTSGDESTWWKWQNSGGAVSGT